uniref:Uncharacterized protein n=1 Tax=Timema monikensis TaxID=170555 RepID=A0A7R9E6U9_9NEOP|nr:unnamed protein product [Timema monikensis]
MPPWSDCSIRSSVATPLTLARRKWYNTSQLAKDLLHPSPIEEKRKHKLKRLVQHPNSYFMDVKCPGLLNYCSGVFRV